MEEKKNSTQDNKQQDYKGNTNVEGRRKGQEYVQDMFEEGGGFKAGLKC